MQSKIQDGGRNIEKIQVSSYTSPIIACIHQIFIFRTLHHSHLLIYVHYSSSIQRVLPHDIPDNDSNRNLVHFIRQNLYYNNYIGYELESSLYHSTLQRPQMSQNSLSLLGGKNLYNLATVQDHEMSQNSQPYLGEK